MPIVAYTQISCDFSGCPEQTSDDITKASVAGWTYTQSTYPLDGTPTTEVRCPTHKGQ